MTLSASVAAVGRGFKTFAGDVAEGFFEITHNGLALVGIVVVVLAALLGARPDLRHQGEQQLTEWLTARKIAAMGITPELGAIERATAANPRDLPREQANVALWISKKYRVAPEPVAALVDAEVFARIRRMQGRFDALSQRIADAYADVPMDQGLAEIDRAAARVRRG